MRVALACTVLVIFLAACLGGRTDERSRAVISERGIVNVDLDEDQDGVGDTRDNCRVDFNPGQADFDSDGQGNACDLDDDGDGIEDTQDNCPYGYNPFQNDRDNNGRGNACDDALDTSTLCPNGFLKREHPVFTLGWGLEAEPIAPGEEKIYCMDTRVLVKAEELSIFIFEWDAQEIYTCGSLEVRLEQAFAPFALIQDGSSGGTVRFTRKRCGDCAKHGLYRVILRGSDDHLSPNNPKCNRYHVGWHAG